jgi:hypothetical protein
VRTSILLSKAESTEKTPTKTPAGGKESKLGGGKGSSGVSVVEPIGLLAPEPEVKNSGGVDGGGTEQYARHGKGSLSGLRIYISRRVRNTAKTERRRSVKSYNPRQNSIMARKLNEKRTMVIGCLGKAGCRYILLMHFFTIRINLLSLFRRRRRVDVPIIHQLRLESLGPKPPCDCRSGESGSESVSEVQEEEWLDEKN